jgi:predicted permease
MSDRVLFVALILLISYALKRLSLFREEHSVQFINYVIYFSLPALVFQKVRELDLGSRSVEVPLFAWAVIGASLVVSLLVGKALRLGSRTLRAFVLVSSFGNTAFMGYPFTYAFFGDEGLKYAILYDQLGSFLMVVSVGFFVATGKFSLREVFFFPPFLALVGGILLRGVGLPAVLEDFLEVSGKSLIPVVLFAIGLKFSLSHLSNSLGLTFLSLLIKMVLAPLAVLIVLKAGGLEELHHRVILLESAMPPMVMAGVLAIKYGLDEKVALSSITLGIALSFITVPLVMSL